MNKTHARTTTDQSTADLIARLDRRINQTLARRISEKGLFDCQSRTEVGTVPIAGHSVDIRVTCRPAQFWSFRITGPTFRGEVSTGSGSLTDFWWAVEALVQGRVRVARTGNTRCAESGRSYALTGSGDGAARLRQLLLEGMLVVASQP